MTSTHTDFDTTAALARKVRQCFNLTSAEAADQCDAFYTSTGDEAFHAAAVWLWVAARYGEVDLDRVAAGTPS